MDTSTPLGRDLALRSEPGPPAAADAGADRLTRGVFMASGGSGEARRRERAGANDGEAGKYRPTLRCPMRCRSIRGGGGVAPPEGVPGSEADRGAYVPYPGSCRARHCYMETPGAREIPRGG